MNPFVLLTADQTRQADRRAIEGGIAGAQLMDRAGTALARYVIGVFKQQDTNAAAAAKPNTLIACGPGNNGGDGFVLARLLRAEGWPVTVAFHGNRADMSGDAKLMADLYDGPLVPLEPSAIANADLIVDALFGTGLNRPVSDPYAGVIAAINNAGKPVIAVDIPSGVNADTGAIMATDGQTAIRARATVTFATRNPGHVLFPGRSHCGDVQVADIGIPNGVLASLRPTMSINDIALWGQSWAQPGPMDHKYSRGAAGVVSGPMITSGAARLAARAALRVGAGAVTVLAPGSALMTHAGHLTAIMLRRANTADYIAAFLDDERVRSIVIGPGLLGSKDETERKANRAKVLACLGASARCILDADALTLFEDNPDTLFSKVRPDDILTPHSGEFARLFPDLGRDLNAGSSKIEIVKTAAEIAGGVVVLKGGDTVIAAPAQKDAPARASVNVNAPPDLATAGSGDVLAGFIAGLAAGRHPTNGKLMPAYEAACGGVWLHGACGQYAGRGLIAEDLPDVLPDVFQRLLSPRQEKS